MIQLNLAEYEFELIDETEEFVIHNHFIEITDWKHNKYKVGFDGKFL